MGIFNKFINKVLDAEVPPAIEKLATKVAAEKQKLSDTALFSMTIDDVFSIAGRGTVVTGKISSGVIKLNNEVIITGGTELRGAKVTGIEKFNKILSEAKIGDEVGLLLDGISKNTVKKGYIVADSNHPIIKSYSEGEVIPVREVQNKKPEFTAEFGKVIYSERYIPDDSDEAKQIMAEREKYKNETTEQHLQRLAMENHQRMEEAGLTMYVWETSGDERVCDACKIMDEKLCRWDDPTVYSEDGSKTWKHRPEGAAMTHPGEHKECPDHAGCRCTAVSYYPELVGEI